MTHETIRKTFILRIKSLFVWEKAWLHEAEKNQAQEWI